MSAQPTAAAVPIHLRLTDYHLIGAADLDGEGLSGREVVGPCTSIAAVGPLVVVHDRTFEPHANTGRQPHRGMQQLFYVIDGQLRHTDSVERMEGTVRTGELGILTEGREGMGHIERNEGDVPARVYVLAYPAAPMPDEATFTVIDEASMPRGAPHPGVETKSLVGRDRSQVHGQLHEFADVRFEAGGTLSVELEPGQAGLLFCLGGGFRLIGQRDGPATSLGVDETALFAPAPEMRRIVVEAEQPGRLLYAITGTGFGFRLQDSGG